MAEALQTSDIPKGWETDWGEWELESEPPEHFHPVDGRNKSSQGGASCQKAGREPSQAKRFFKKRVMNIVQCCNDVKGDEDGDVSRVHGWGLLRGRAGRASEECLGKG